MKNLIWNLLGVLLAVLITINIYDRFTGNGDTWMFQDKEDQYTCVIAKLEGQHTMDCYYDDHTKP